MVTKGRRVIKMDVSYRDLEDINVLCNVVNTGMSVHMRNKAEIDYLMNYYKGDQPVLNKEKEIRSEINNKLVLNHAQMITRKIVGYFLGNPIQYIPSGISQKKELIEELNIYTQYENKPSVDKELGEYQSICGTAYRIIYRDGDFSGRRNDSVPFEDRVLDPSTTFMVYESNISGYPLVGVTHHDVYNEDDEFVGIRYYAYTDFGRYEFLSDGLDAIIPSDLVDFIPYDVGGIPIIEYPNNTWRIGDWELVVGLMNSINDLNSGRLDDIDQIIQSLIVFINAEIDEEVYAEMRAQGVVMLNNSENAKSDVKTIINNLDQNGMNLFSTELEDLLYSLVGVPSRNDGASGGDTGLAIELRDGWADLEIICKNKELIFRDSEKKTLDVLLHIFNIGRTEKLEKLDLDIKFSRNKNNNMLVKTQSYQSLLSTRTLSPADCLSIVDLVSDPNDYIERGLAFWKTQEIEEPVKSDPTQGDLNNDNSVSNTLGSQ
ncbi:MAG TPA: phage portal protein [Tissierellaceae bacterium]|nr:phage portal protein [Tissierellaceae bacterium]